MDMNGITLEEVVAERNRRAQSKQGKVAPTQPRQSEGLILDLVNKLDPSGAVANTLGRTATGFMGKDSPQNDYQKMYNQELIKKQFEDPTEKAIKQDYLQARADQARRQPFYQSDLGQDYYGAKTRQAGAQAENFELGSGMVRDAIGGNGNQGGNIPVGTTITSGGVTVPMNPKLDEAQTNVISGTNKYEPMVGRLEQLVNEGALEGPGHKLMAEYGNKSMVGRYLTPDNTPIEELASIASELQKYMFSEGGKTLSPTEKSIVNSGLTFAGKGNEQIKHDFSEAIKILRLKKDLIFGGMNAAMQQQPSQQFNQPTQNTTDYSQMSDEELIRLAGGQ